MSNVCFKTQSRIRSCYRTYYGIQPTHTAQARGITRVNEVDSFAAGTPSSIHAVACVYRPTYVRASVVVNNYKTNRSTIVRLIKKFSHLKARTEQIF